MKQELLDYIEAHRTYGYDLLAQLGQIPAPSNHEEQRAKFVCDWFHQNGAPQAFIDEALNVVCPIGVTDTNPVTVFMAHLDVVFPDTDPLPLKVEDGKMCCPGIGDDTANLAALLMAAKYVLEKGLQPANGKGFVFVANSGEEGLGNLKGSRQICQRYGSRIEEFVSFDGYYSGLCNDAVGSERWRVEIRTEGGHSFGCFGNRNAIAYLASMIGTLYEMKPPVTKTRTTYNVGTIQGGTSVNTIAQQAEMLYEYRSDSADDLAFMRRHFEAVVEAYRAKGVAVDVELLGQRPCSGTVDPARMADLQNRISAAVEAGCGAQPGVHASSTDANIPLSMGIPAITVGVVDGAGAHTREEYVLIDSLVKGYRCAYGCILPYFGVEV